MPNSTRTTDATQRFLFSDTNVRGEFTQLTDSYAQVLAKHQYPEAIEDLLEKRKPN